MSQSIEQQRAAHALDTVQFILGKFDANLQRACRSAARSLPAELTIQGLGQTLALLRGGDKPELAIYYTLEAWLTQTGRPYAGSADLLQAITTRDQNDYLAAQAEAIKLAAWLKKFAAALIDAPTTLRVEAADEGASAAAPLGDAS